MMHRLNCKIIIIPLLLLLTGSCSAMSKNETKFEWGATENAPRPYPMEIIEGTFFYHGESDQGLYIPYGGTLRSSWGEPISSHAVGDKFKPLPDRLKIIFFSYTEKQFYKGDFDLPYENILALFRDGVANPRVFPNGETYPHYSRIMAGIAPGGVVAVWVIGSKKAEVFFGQAQKIELSPSAAFRLPFKDKQESDDYIKNVLEDVLKPEELESIKQNGIPFGLWARYRNRYDWIPTASVGYSLKDVNSSFLNGENISDWLVNDNRDINESRPVPRKVSFNTRINEKKKIFIVNFDELEIMAAFEKLGANGQKVQLEFEPHLPRSQIKVRLYNDKESIELKKIDSEDW